MRRSIPWLILVAVLAIGSFAFALTPRSVRWSAAAAWPAGVPARDADVVIERGRTVELDVSPPRVGTLTVDGTLVVADRDVRLEARRIIVHGTIEAGSERRPFEHRLTVVLDGDRENGGTADVVSGGRLALYGRPATAWLRLARTAWSGARTVTTDGASGWRPGDRIAVASSGFDARETEERGIVRVDGTTLALDAPLAHRHWGTRTNGVDERAEIALLSHTIEITSDAAAFARGLGGSVTVHAGGALQASNVAFDRLGALGRLGAYPVHFHFADDQRASFVASSSIAHSLNRCLTIHGTNRVRVSDTVAFDAIGSCYFLEDGSETGNVFERDLGMLTRAASPKRALLESDVQPATFWIANPANDLRGDVAAGSQGTGFWYDLSPHPVGKSADATVWPRRTPLGANAGNVAHSNEHNGLFVDVLRNPPGVTEAPNYEPPAIADFAAFTSYKNRRRGVWLRGEHLRLSHATIADNSIGVTFAGSDAQMTDSLVVGETGNATGPPKPFEANFPIRGFEFYDGLVGVSRSRFVNFRSNAVRRASALGTLQYSPFFTDPKNFASGLSFENAEPVYFAAHHGARDVLGADGYRSTVVRDSDGSVTGRPGVAVVLDTPFFAEPDCTRHAAWNALVCDASYARLFIIGVGDGRRQPGPIRVASADRPAYLTLYGNPVPGRDAMYQTNVRSDRPYVISFAKRFPAHLRLGVHDFATAHGVELRFPQAPPAAVVRGGAARSSVVSRRDGATLVVDFTSDAARDGGGAVFDVCSRASCS